MKKTRILSVILAVILCLTLTVPALAISGSGTGDTQVSTSVTITKNLIMKKGVPTPGATFNFTLAPATITGEASFPLFAGDMTGVKVNGQAYPAGGVNVTFTAGAAATDGLPSDTDTATEGKQYVQNTFSIDFSGVTFPAPGVYRYVLTETAVADPSPFNIASTTTNPQYIDVYVEYEQLSDGSYASELSIQGIFLHNENGTVSTDPATAGTTGEVEDGDAKSQGVFDNEYTTFDLEVKKQVTGNQGDRKEHFSFSILVTNPTTAGATYPTQYKLEYDGITNCEKDFHAADAVADETITAGSALTVQLKDGESVKIVGLPKGATYTIVETTAGYVASATVNGETHTDDDTVGTTFTVQDTEGLAADTTVVYTNNRSGAVPTGVLLTIAPFAVLMLVGAVGAVLVLKKKHTN